MRKKFALGLLALLLIAAGTAAAFGDRLLLRFMQRQVEANLSGTKFAEFPDGLNLVLCGAGSPLPDPQRAGPCVAVIAGSRVVIVDAGSGAIRNLAPAGIPVGRVDDVLLTHFHSDHIDGLGELMLQRWAGGNRSEPLPVHGPTGVESVVEGFNRAYTHDFGYRVAHHGPTIVPPAGAGGRARPFALPKEGEGVVVLDADGFKVTAFAVTHAPVEPAVGYRFDYRGRSLLISGDTAKSANLAHFAKDVDLLVHEALAPHLVDILTAGARQAGAQNMAQLTVDILDYHTTPVQAAEIARDAGARHLLYYHIVPALPLRRLEHIFVRGVSEVYDGGVTVGRDRSWVSLPAGSDEIRIGRRG